MVKLAFIPSKVNKFEVQKHIVIYVVDDPSTSVPKDFTLVAVRQFQGLSLDNISGLYVLLDMNVDVKSLKDLLVKVAKVKSFRGFSTELVFLIDENYNIDVIKRVVNALPLNYTYVIKSTVDLEKLLTSDVINTRESKIVVVDDKAYWPDKDVKLVKRVSDDLYVVYRNPFYEEFRGKLEISLDAVKKSYQLQETVGIKDSLSYWHFKGIVVELTYDCNFSCDHCYIPKSPQKLELDKVKRILEEAINLPFIDKKVYISGGEPTLFWKDLSELVKFAKSLGYYVTLVTNGSWAVDETKELKVDEVELSLTPYHLKFWNKGDLVKALRNLKRKYPLTVRYLTSKSHTVYELYKLLGEELIGVTVISSPVLRLGKSAIKDSYGENKLPSGACFNSLYLTITPNGIYPCNNGSEVTKYGKILELDEPLTSLNFVRMLTLKGPSRLLRELGLDGKYANKKYVSICELCNEILNDDEVYNEFRRRY